MSGSVTAGLATPWRAMLLCRFVRAVGPGSVPVRMTAYYPSPTKRLNPELPLHPCMHATRMNPLPPAGPIDRFEASSFLNAKEPDRFVTSFLGGS